MKWTLHLKSKNLIIYKSENGLSYLYVNRSLRNLDTFYVILDNTRTAKEADVKEMVSRICTKAELKSLFNVQLTK